MTQMAHGLKANLQETWLLHLFTITEGSLEVKLRTIWTDGKAEVGRVREEKSRKREYQRRERVIRKKMQVRESRDSLRFFE